MSVWVCCHACGWIQIQLRPFYGLWPGSKPPTDPTVSAPHARHVAKVVVHEHGEGAVVVVVGTQGIRDPHHAIGAAVGFVVHALAPR